MEKNFLIGSLCTTKMMLSSISSTLEHLQNGHLMKFEWYFKKKKLPKEIDFNEVNQTFVSSNVGKRNGIPRKSLKYRTPLEVFLSYIVENSLSSLI